MLDVIFYEAFEEEAELLKKYLPENIKAEFTPCTIQECDDPKPADIISIRTQSIIPKGWHIKAILTRSTGYDHIKKYSAQLGYLPLYCNRAVAEQSILLCLSLLRKLPLQLKQFNSFHRDGLTGNEAKGKHILVVGVGNIGYQICRIAKGLEMDVYGVDIVKKHDDINYVDISSIKDADIIVCSMNLTEHNHLFFDYSLLSKSKKGAIFVNVARGELSPAKDLLRLIEEKHLAAAALDVYNKEHAVAESIRKGKVLDDEVKYVLELAKKDNVMLTPHNSFNTIEAVERKAMQSVQQVEHFLKNKSFIWQVPCR